MTSEWLQIRHKTQVSDTFEVGKLYFKIDSYLPDFRDSVIFPYISLYTQAVAYTTYVESAARRALKNTSKRRLLSLGSLCSYYHFVYIKMKCPVDLYFSKKQFNKNKYSIRPCWIRVVIANEARRKLTKNNKT